MICRHCGEEFTNKDRRVRYCSDECKKSAIRERSKASHLLGLENPITKICVVCGNEFKCGSYGAETRVQTCSKKCKIQKASESRKNTTPKDKTQKRIKKKESDIDSINAKARDMGLSYGQYQAIKLLDQARVKL